MTTTVAKIASSAIDRIISYTAQKYESGKDSYWAFVDDDNGAGSSFGYIQFNQKKGSLPQLFQHMRKLAPVKFDTLFGPYAAQLADPNQSKNMDLTQPDIKSRIIRAGHEPEFQKAQHDFAKSKYFDSAAAIAAQYGLKSERAHAMLFDTNVQRGEGNTRKLLAEAVGEVGGSAATPMTPEREKAILTKFASKADTKDGQSLGTRRMRMLIDTYLTDASIYAVAGGGLVLLLVGAFVIYRFYYGKR